ncbi:hypothetical protein KYK27_00275 [Pontibacter populi]|uniref:Uncharacterized protein n=1 Tax=Pontibacter populi TaxID=890055 RepID=A0ABS6X646_9BACT|nr:hypothetical protein [Pontibacter populi]
MENTLKLSICTGKIPFYTFHKLYFSRHYLIGNYSIIPDGWKQFDSGMNIATSQCLNIF